MKVIALAGGYGTRLGDLTKNVPKALLDVAGQPLLTYTLAKLQKLQDVDEIIVVSNEKFYKVLQEWADSVSSTIPIKVLNDGTTSNENRLGSVGDLLFAIEQENITEPVLLIGTDNFFTFDLNHVVLRGLEANATTIGLYDVQDIEQAKLFGIAEVSEEGKLLDFVEKPQEPPSTLSLMMLWYIVPKDFAHIKDCVTAGKADRAGDFIAYLMEKSPVYSVTYDKPFYDVGSVEVYEQLNKLLKDQSP